MPENPPQVAILGTGNGQRFSSQGAELHGAAYGPKDGMLPATALTWSSDRDGSLGKGARVKTKPLSVGTHVITLNATNSRGHSASERVNIVVRRD